jgi:chromosome segregation ATPase
MTFADGNSSRSGVAKSSDTPYRVRMYRIVALMALVFCLGFSRAQAAGADDLFIAIYNLIQQADTQVDSGNSSAAVTAYSKAQEDLKLLNRQYPSWNERVVNYRLRYVAERLATLKAAGASAATPKTNLATATSTPKTVQPGDASNALAPAGEVIEQFNALNEQIQRLATEKNLLEAKLREALSAQPAPVDPRQLQEAVERITSLQQTNKVLLLKLDEQEKERKNLVEKVVIEEAQRALNEANRQLLEQRLAASAMEKAKTETEAQLRQLQDGPLKKLEGENSALKEQVTQLRADTEKGRQVAELAGKLGRLQTQLDEYKAQNEKLLADKTALEKHLGDANLRKAEESIVRVAKLETDLALAQADAIRNSQKAESLAAALSEAKASSDQLENQNRSLEDRVASLTKENTSASNTVKRLQDALAEEQMERSQLEQTLRQTERQLASLKPSENRTPIPRTEGGPNAVRPPVPVPDPETLQRIAQLETEAKSLRIAVRDSREREGDVKNLLAEEQTLRVQLQREKLELEKRLITLQAIVATNTATATAKTVAARSAPLPVMSPSAQVTASLEKRVRELERQRDELQQRLTAVGVRMDNRNSPMRLRITTPREQAAEFRNRQAQSAPSGSR